MTALGTALALFPPREEKLARRAAPRNAAEAKERKAHEWEFAHGSWRCIWCWKYRRSRMKPKFRAADRCPGPEADDHLRRAEGTLPVIVCGTCGGWSARRRYRLAYKCGVPTAAGEAALKRIAMGRHPWIGRKTGHSGVRSELSVTSRFCAGKGKWKTKGDGRYHQRCGARGMGGIGGGGHAGWVAREKGRMERVAGRYEDFTPSGTFVLPPPCVREESEKFQRTDEGATAAKASKLSASPRGFPVKRVGVRRRTRS